MSVSFTGGEDGTARPITKALQSAFPTKPELERIVLYVVGQPLNALVNTDTDHTATVFELCSKLNAIGGLESFLRGAARDRPNNPKLRALHQDLFGEPPSPADGMASAAPPVAAIHVHDSCVLGDDIVFIDRKPFRRFMKDIHDWSVKRLVVVTGGPKSGKTYSAELIRYGARKLGYQTVTIPLESLPKEQEVQVQALARHIVGPIQPLALVAGVPDQGKESEARWLHHPLMHWIGGWMRQAQGTWWLIFDGFDRDLLDPNVYEFLTDLGMKIENDLPNFRLAVLGYDRSIPAPWAERVRHEIIQDLQRQDLVDFYTRLYEEKGLAPDHGTIEHLADDLYDEFARRQEAFAQQAADPSIDDDPATAPMRYVNGKLVHLLSRLSGGAPS